MSICFPPPGIHPNASLLPVYTPQGPDSDEDSLHHCIDSPSDTDEDNTLEDGALNVELPTDDGVLYAYEFPISDSEGEDNSALHAPPVKMHTEPEPTTWKKRKRHTRGVALPNCRKSNSMGAVETAMRRSSTRTTTHIFEPSLMEQLKEALKGNQEILEKAGYIKKYYEASSSTTENIQVALEAVRVGSSNQTAALSQSYALASGTSTVSLGLQAMKKAFRKGSVYNVFRRFKTLLASKKSGPCMKRTLGKSQFVPAIFPMFHGEGSSSDQQLVAVSDEVPMAFSSGLTIGELELPYMGSSGSSHEMSGNVAFTPERSGMDIDYPIPTETESGDGYESSDGSVTGQDNMEMVLYVLPTDIPGDETMAIVPYLKVKWASSNSEYPESPFALNLPHSSVDKKSSRALSTVLQSGEFDDGVWFLSSCISGGILLGSDLAEQMKRGVAFGARLCDAVILSLTELDGQMYGTDRKHWKGYLPASFAEIVFGSYGDSYLADARDRDMFIGDHLPYDFEHCRKIVAPVEFDQTDSCYVWDLSAMDCQVLDPVLMNTSEKNAEEHHWAVKFLTEALVKCVNNFFHGWRLLEGEWFLSAPTNVSRRCRPYNSAVYTLHYARWYATAWASRRGLQIWNLATFEGTCCTSSSTWKGRSLRLWPRCFRLGSARGPHRPLHHRDKASVTY